MSIDQHNIDQRVDTIVRDNAEILRMLEFQKTTPPEIKHAAWTEIVEFIV